MCLKFFFSEGINIPKNKRGGSADGTGSALILMRRLSDSPWKFLVLSFFLSLPRSRILQRERVTILFQMRFHAAENRISFTVSGRKIQPVRRAN